MGRKVPVFRPRVRSKGGGEEIFLSTGDIPLTVEIP